jgi:hypothetical protein
VITGRLSIGGLMLKAGDGCALRDERHLALFAHEAAEVLVVETMTI